MFVQIKKSGGAEYIYVIESYRRNGIVAHRTVKKLGRLDKFLEKDPEALEKLREEVRRNSSELRNFSTASAVAQIRSLAIKRENEQLQEGMPSLNYANFVLKAVWCGCLKLDYRLNYLQRRYYPDFKRNFNNIFFERVLARILKFENTRLKFGIETALLGSNFDPEIPPSNDDVFYNLVSKEREHILTFIKKRMLDDLDIDPKMLRPDFIDEEKFQSLVKGSDENLEMGQLCFDIVCSAVVKVMVKKITDAGINADFDEILNSLRRAVLLVDFPFGDPQAPVLYIKANNGHYVRTMNGIMKALGLLPLLNIQDKTELSRRLRTKFTSDDQIIPFTMLHYLSNVEIKNSAFA